MDAVLRHTPGHKITIRDLGDAFPSRGLLAVGHVISLPRLLLPMLPIGNMEWTNKLRVLRSLVESWYT